MVTGLEESFHCLIGRETDVGFLAASFIHQGISNSFKICFQAVHHQMRLD